MDTIFMKCSGSEYIIHCLFVDDLMHIYSWDAIKEEFMQLSSKDFESTGGRQMKTFLGMQVEQTLYTRSVGQDSSRSIHQGSSGWICGIHQEGDSTHSRRLANQDCLECFACSLRSQGPRPRARHRLESR
jgi:hypothetical protein